MKNIYSIEFHTGSKEELLPDFANDYPYIASRVELDKHIGRYTPWHWHKAVELFYMESGSLEYDTPGGKLLFPAGSGGMINSNVLHMTKATARTQETVQLIHIFDTSLLSGEQGSRIEQKYITPLTASPQIELIPLFPVISAMADTLQTVRSHSNFFSSITVFLHLYRSPPPMMAVWEP